MASEQRESFLKSDSVRSATRSLLNRALMGGAACVVALGLMSCSEGSAERKVASAPAVKPAEYPGTVAHVRRISVDQYRNTITHIFGHDIEVGNPFAPLRRTDGLIATGASSAGVTSGELQQLQRSAATIAAQVLDKGNIEQKTPSRRDFLVPCKPADVAAADDACAAKFISQTSRLLYRRPLPEARVTELVATAHKGATDLKDFYAGLGTVLEGMLIDPKVLLIADVVENDPANPGKKRLDAYSLASRLSFFLWNAAPDDAVLKAAERGDLFDAKKRAKVVDMMLASPRLENGVRAFFDDMFAFDSFAALAKDAQMYPVFTGVTATDAPEETLRVVVDHLITKNLDYRDLYTTRDTFISPRLAAVYKLPATPTWSRYTFPEGSPRAGILTHVSFLAVHSHPVRSSPTMRGKALRELLLCQPVPPPPANVDFSALENPKATLRTTRDRVNFHLENPVCAGCHKITDPMGLGLENFDGIGAYRETEKGQKIDASGALDGKAFQDAVGLGKALRDHPALPSCLVKRAFAYGAGSPTTNADRPLLAYFNTKFGEEGYRLPALLRTITMSDAFIRINEPKPAASEKSASAPTAATVAANSK